MKKGLIFGFCLIIAAALGYKMNQEGSLDLGSKAPVEFDGQYSKVKKVFDNRCVACHSCFNAPCQLNLASIEGIQRGYHKTEKVYNASRLLGSAVPARLFIDNKEGEVWKNNKSEIKEWGDLEFNSALEGYTGFFDDGLGDVPDLSSKPEMPALLLSVIDPKSEHVSMPSKPAEKSRQCNKVVAGARETFYPMPYDLPGLDSSERNAIVKWVNGGAKFPSDAKQKNYKKSSIPGTLEKWEKYFNGDELEEHPKLVQKLISRYIYEHLFNSHIYFSKKKNEYYNLMRSTTSSCRDSNSNETVVDIGTRRPYDMPNPPVEFRYCFRKVTSTIVHKTHIVYQLNSDRMARYKELFDVKSIKLAELPAYNSDKKFDTYNFKEVRKKDRKFVTEKDYKAANGAGLEKIADASNPFTTFQALPAKSRYKFLLDDAYHFVMTFIRGSVCRGPSAVNVINEQFFVLFQDPNFDPNLDQLLQKTAKLLRQPAAFGSAWVTLPAHGFLKEMYGNAIPPAKHLPGGIIGDFNKYRQYRAHHYKDVKFSIDSIWDGSDSWQKNSDQAALTVFRNYDSASVEKGLLGGHPKTMWMMDYPLFESIFYNLVASFDVYGVATHQLSTRLYMGVQRIIGEDNFLEMMPIEARQKLRENWYQSGEDGVWPLWLLQKVTKITLKNRMKHWYFLTNTGQNGFPKKHSGVAFEKGLSGNTLKGAKKMMAYVTDKAIEKIKNKKYLNDPINRAKGVDSDPIYSKLSSIVGKTFSNKTNNYVALMPEISYLHIVKDGSVQKDQVYTIIRHKILKNVAWLSEENKRRDPDQDSISIVHQFVGSYPNRIFRVKLAQLDEFIDGVKALNDKSYSVFMAKWSVDKEDKNNADVGVKFWDEYDFLNAKLKYLEPIEAGIIDLNRFGLDTHSN